MQPTQTTLILFFSSQNPHSLPFSRRHSSVLSCTQSHHVLLSVTSLVLLGVGRFSFSFGKEVIDPVLHFSSALSFCRYKLHLCCKCDVLCLSCQYLVQSNVVYILRYLLISLWTLLNYRCCPYRGKSKSNVKFGSNNRYWRSE